MTVIPGVELSTDTPSGEVHVLGYFIDYNDQEFKNSLERMRNSRAIRAEKMVAKLKELGCNIELARIKEIAGNGALGRAHVAQALLEKGYITSFKEAFTKYIGHDCPAYVGREKLTPAEAVQLVLKANGLPVLAHPFTSTKSGSHCKRIKISRAGGYGSLLCRLSSLRDKCLTQSGSKIRPYSHRRHGLSWY